MALWAAYTFSPEGVLPMLDLEPAARRMAAVVDAVKDDQLSAPTPCEAYTVGDLLDHVMGLTVAFTDAAEKRASDTASQPPSPSGERLDPEWRERIPERLERLVAAWRAPQAWQGSTMAGGATLPAEVMGMVALDELVLHGWDLARATGQPYDCDPASAEAVFEFTSASAAPGEEEGRKGVFGPVIPVPDTAPLFHRALGLSGRNPTWTP